MPGRPLGCPAGLQDPFRCAPVGEHALGGIDCLVHGRADDRMRELDVRRPHAEQIGASERRRGVGGDLELEARQLCDAAELRPVAEDRRRARKPRRLRRQAGQSQRDGPRHRLGADLEHAVGVAGDRRQLFGDDRRQQRPQEERVAAGRREAGLGERALRTAPELLGGELDHGLDPERTRADQDRRRIGDELGQKLGLLALLGRAQTDHNRQCQTLQPAREVGEPAQRRPVRPVQVVDRDHGRAPERDVCGQPVEPVQHPERDVAFLRDELALGEEPLGERGRTGEQLAARLGSCACDQRLEELAENAVGEVLLELGAARIENLEPRLLGDGASLVDEPGLSHPGPAFDRDHVPAATGGQADRLLDRPQLRLSLEQRCPNSARGDRRPSLSEARAERGEGVGKSRHDELVEPLRALEVRHLRLAEVPQPDVLGQVVLDQPGGRAREEDLAALPDVTDARSLVDGEADVAVAAGDSLTGVEAHPHLHLVAAGPRLGAKRGLGRSGRRDRRARTAENSEEGISLPVDLDSAGGLERPGEQPIVGRQQLRVAVAADLFQQPRRALDVREQEGDGAGRELLFSFAQVLTTFFVELAWLRRF